MSASQSARAAHGWERVRVDRLELERATPPAALARVAVSVALGALLPVDVDVELTIEDGSDASLAEVRTERMWSAHCYQNDRYLFEAHLPDEAIAHARRIAVRIHPAGERCGEASRGCVVPTVELDLAPRVEDGP